MTDPVGGVTVRAVEPGTTVHLPAQSEFRMTYTYDGVEYHGVVVENTSSQIDPASGNPATFTPDQPMQWYYGEPKGDAVSPDTSQPYPLDDLIARIDELT